MEANKTTETPKRLYKEIGCEEIDDNNHVEDLGVIEGD